MPKKKRISIGAVVRSGFRASWYGVVVEHDLGPGTLLVVVRRTHDRRGNPLRKTSLFRLSSGWLRVIPKEDKIALEATQRVAALTSTGSKSGG